MRAVAKVRQKCPRERERMGLRRECCTEQIEGEDRPSCVCVCVCVCVDERRGERREGVWPRRPALFASAREGRTLEESKKLREEC